MTFLNVRNENKIYFILKFLKSLFTQWFFRKKFFRSFKKNMNILKNLVLVGLLTTGVVFCANYGGLVEGPPVYRGSLVKVAPALNNVGASHTKRSNDSPRLKRGPGYTRDNDCWILQPSQQPFTADRGAGSSLLVNSIVTTVKAGPAHHLSTSVSASTVQWESVKPKRKTTLSNDKEETGKETGHEDKRLRKSALPSPVSSYLLGGPQTSFGAPATPEEKPKRVSTPYPNTTSGSVPSFPAPESSLDAKRTAWSIFGSHASPTILNKKVG